jgi:YfiH family protein
MRRIYHNTVNGPNGLNYYVFEHLAAQPGLDHAVFTRHGGVSQPPFNTLNWGSTLGDALEAVGENFRRATAALDIPPERTATSWQVHGTHALVLDRPNRAQRPPPQADILLSDTPDVWLTMRFADCVPILLYDPVQRAVGIAHAGWRGTLAGAARAAVEALGAAFGSRPADLLAGIGPAIGPCCYRVGAEVVEAFQHAFGPQADAWLLPPPSPKALGEGGRGVRATHLDLWEANRAQLAAAGVEQIEVAALCTADLRQDFFSHRGDKGQTGRFGALIGLRRGNG